MAQVDWFVDCLADLSHGGAIASMVSSGDIDAVPIHMFSISYIWPRSEDGSFIHPVYVILQKPGGLMDVYCITSILETLEKWYEDRLVGMKVAMGLCLGGNDFLPKFHGYTHDRILSLLMGNEIYRQHLFELNVANRSGSVSVPMLCNLLKHLYCPAAFEASKLTYDEIRQYRIMVPQKTHAKARPTSFWNPQSWLPLVEAIEKLSRLVECQLEYLFTAGFHEADTPDFL